MILDFGKRRSRKMAVVEFGSKKRPPKGSWRKAVPFCTKRGHHNYKDRGILTKKKICMDCGFTVEGEKHGIMRSKQLSPFSR